MTISVYLIIWLAFVHWIGDFILQSDRLAVGKSSDNQVLTLHVLIYTLTLMSGAALFSGASSLLGGHVFSSQSLMVFGVLNGVLHWITDWFTSRQTAKCWKEERRHDFFVWIGADQHCFHLPTLALTAAWLLQ